MDKKSIVIWVMLLTCVLAGNHNTKLAKSYEDEHCKHTNASRFTYRTKYLYRPKRSAPDAKSAIAALQPIFWTIGGSIAQSQETSNGKSVHVKPQIHMRNFSSELSHHFPPANVDFLTCVDINEPKPPKTNRISFALNCQNGIDHYDLAYDPTSDVLEIPQADIVPRIAMVVSMNGFLPKITPTFQVPWDTAWTAAFDKSKGQLADTIIERYTHGKQQHVELQFFRINPKKYYSLYYTHGARMNEYFFNTAWSSHYFAENVAIPKLKDNRFQLDQIIHKIEVLAKEANDKLVVYQLQMFKLVHDCDPTSEMIHLRKEMLYTMHDFNNAAAESGRKRMVAEKKMVMFFELARSVNHVLLHSSGYPGDIRTLEHLDEETRKYLHDGMDIDKELAKQQSKYYWYQAKSLPDSPNKFPFGDIVV